MVSMITLQKLAIFITILAIFATGVFLTCLIEGKSEKTAAKESLSWGLAFALGFSGYFISNGLLLTTNLD